MALSYNLPSRTSCVTLSQCEVPSIARASMSTRSFLAFYGELAQHMGLNGSNNATMLSVMLIKLISSAESSSSSRRRASTFCPQGCRGAFKIKGVLYLALLRLRQHAIVRGSGVICSSFADHRYQRHNTTCFACQELCEPRVTPPSLNKRCAPRQIQRDKRLGCFYVFESALQRGTVVWECMPHLPEPGCQLGKLTPHLR